MGSKSVRELRDAFRRAYNLTRSTLSPNPWPTRPATHPLWRLRNPVVIPPPSVTFSAAMSAGKRMLNTSCNSQSVKNWTSRVESSNVKWLHETVSRHSAFWKAMRVRDVQSLANARLLGGAAWACSRSPVIPLIAMLLGESVLGRRRNPVMADASAYYSLPVALSASSFSSPSQFILAVMDYLWESVRLAIRTAYLIVLFTPLILSAPLVNSLGGRFRQPWLHLVHSTLESAGAAFIKWGQWAATRPDLFPQDLCAQLSKLHTKAPVHSFEITRSTIENAFGRKLTDIFDDFEAQPVASGSIAQVHRAVLKRRYAGIDSAPEVVAVKVRHPGVGDMIRRDFLIMKWMAKISSILPGIRWLRLQDSVQQFATFMMTQVDLAREAAHLSRFSYNFRHWSHVSFPRPVYPLVHPCVLVESFEQGESVTRYVDRVGGRDHINSELASLGSNTLLKMLLIDNFIHADMHPGNILVRVKRGSSNPIHPLRGQPHVVLLDVGMTAELSSRDRSNMLEFFRAVATRNGVRVAECTLKFTDKQNCPDPQKFIEDVDASFKEWDKRGGRIPTGECMQDLLERVRRHRVNIDGNVCTVMITTLVLEGWQRKLDPDLSVMDTLHSILFKPEWLLNLSYTIHNIMAP